MNHTVNHKTIIKLSLVTGILMTILLSIGHLYIKAQGIADHDFHFFLTLIFNLLSFYVLFIYACFIMQTKLPAVIRYLLTIIGTLGLSFALTFVAKCFKGLLYGEVIINNKLINIDLLKDSIVALTVLLTTFLLFSLTRRQQIIFENQQLASENMRIRFEALEKQLDPHFLFNSLNTLNGLIGEDDNKAHEYVQQLAATYRYIIQNNKLLQLREELVFTKSYIYLMQIRYGKNLIVINDIKPSFLDYYIVPISLQLLVENAIKHNIISDKHPLDITMRTTTDGKLVVLNPIQAKADEPEGEGIGLVNLVERYRLLLDKEVIIQKTENLFRVEIPLITAEEAQNLNLNIK